MNPRVIQLCIAAASVTVEAKPSAGLSKETPPPNS